jgi:hypothetical protein
MFHLNLHCMCSVPITILDRTVNLYLSASVQVEKACGFIVDCIMCGIETKVLCFETFEIHRKSIEEGRNDSMEEGDSFLALACSG